MKRFLAGLMAVATTFTLAACSGGSGSSAGSSSAGSSSGAAGSSSSASSASGGAKTLIGVSIWSSTDVLGSQCKKMLDAAADALNLKLMYVDQGHVSEKVTASVETLVAAGAKGIIICNSADSEMTSSINTATQGKVYLAQFFRIISKDKSPQVYSLGQQSQYFVGAVHEDEVTNGYNLANILIKKGSRDIALEGWTVGDATFINRWAGYKKAVDEWNQKNASDKVKLSEPQYAGTSAEGGASVTKSFMNSDPKMDALIVAGGGGDPLVGSIGAIKSAGKTGKINVVSTDFLPDLGTQLASGGMTAESGGHFADPLYSLILVNNAINGKYTKPANTFYDFTFPYLYVSSKADYDTYSKYFVDQLPYNADEIKKMASLSYDDLQKEASSLSLADVEKRHGGS